MVRTPGFHPGNRGSIPRRVMRNEGTPAREFFRMTYEKGACAPFVGIEPPESCALWLFYLPQAQTRRVQRSYERKRIRKSGIIPRTASMRSIPWFDFIIHTFDICLN